ncbi:hypothetical protein [Jatrophihabitans fulvus]
MAATTPRLPEQYQGGNDHRDDFVVSELMSEAAGAHSPFGDTAFPVPPQTLFYMHPNADERPNLAGDN